MIYYLIFAICAFYEDIKTVSDKIKGREINQDPIGIEFIGNLDISIRYDGRWTELIYILGIWIGSMFAPEKLIFIVILLLIYIPKTKLLWVVIDTVISIVLISFILLSHYLHY